MPLIQDPNREYRPPLARPEKDMAREKLDADLKAYLSRGGRIQQLSWSDSGLVENIVWISRSGRLNGKSGAARMGASIKPERRDG